MFLKERVTQMDSIVEAVREHAWQQPERIAILFEGRSITYKQLYADSERFAYALTHWGLHAGERVALFLDNCPEFIVAYLGTHLAGGVVVLVNAQYRQVELSHIMNDAGVRLCVTDLAGRAELIPLAVPTLTALVLVGENTDTALFLAAKNEAIVDVAYVDFIEDGSVFDEDSPDTQLELPRADMPAVLGYTSGTTGRSKGALLSHRNLVANIQAISEAWQWRADDHLLLTLPLFHTHGLMVGTHGTLFNGAQLTLHRKFNAASVLVRLRAASDISLFFGVPTMYSRLLAEAEQQGVPEHLPRLFVSGSAPLSPQTFHDFERLFGQTILERYGMTETGMNLTNPYTGERRPGTVGAPFPGQEARVVDVQTRQIAAPGEIGEMEVRGPHVFEGYWQRPEATAEAFAPEGWFKTGDLGWYSEDGYYTITGRARELIISGGYNVYPREVEDVLTSHPAVAEAAVIGLPDADLGEQVVAIIVVAAGQTVTPAALIALCREQLASYKKPRQVYFVDALPRNAMGKVQKHVLSAQLQEPPV